MGYWDNTEDWICGRCLHHKKCYGEWICDNPESESYREPTAYNEKCDDFEARANSGL